MADHLGMFQKGRGAVPQTVILNINLGTQQIAVRNGGSGT